MTKLEAIRQFGSVIKLAHALGVTRQAIHKWPLQLPRSLELKVLGAICKRDHEWDRTFLARHK